MITHSVTRPTRDESDALLCVLSETNYGWLYKYNSTLDFNAFPTYK